MNKIELLKKNLQTLQSVVVAFSGGIDSTFLAYMAKSVLKDNMTAVMAVSPLLSDKENAEAYNLARELDFDLVQIHINELIIKEFAQNDQKRCYYCKKHRFDLICSWAKSHGFNYVLDGSNADDLTDYRPGMQAIMENDMVKSPLLEAGFTKEQIRFWAHKFNISIWNKPSGSCLAARVAYGMPITKEVLLNIDKAENCIKNVLPYNASVRVRMHGDLARIEVSDEHLPVAFENAFLIKAMLKGLGFLYVTIDLEGFHSGSMNKSILN